MTQFDVFVNPITQARRSYPFVVVLQADVARRGDERAVAPAAPRAAFSKVVGRLTPVVVVGREEFVLLVTSLTTIPQRSLTQAIASAASRRHEILGAIDYLFFGV